MRAAKVQASLRIRAVSPEPPLLAHTSSESRGTFRQKARSLAPLKGWACPVTICHDGMLEDTNSLDGAQEREADYNLSLVTRKLVFGMCSGLSVQKHKIFTLQYKAKILNSLLRSSYTVSHPHIYMQIYEPQHDQTNKMIYALIEDSDHPGHSHGLIRVFAFHVKTPWVLSYTPSAHWRHRLDWAMCRLIGVFDGCAWFCLVCRAVTQF